jgi:ribosomal protein S18 acetylase RimI-like enzyme
VPATQVTFPHAGPERSIGARGDDPSPMNATDWGEREIRRRPSSTGAVNGGLAFQELFPRGPLRQTAFRLECWRPAAGLGVAKRAPNLCSGDVGGIVTDTDGVQDSRDAGFSIAEAGDSDVAAIASFLWAAWHTSGLDAPGWAGASEDVLTELTAPDAIQARIGGPNRRLFLAWANGRVVGFAATRTEHGDSAELAGVIVLEDMLGHGIGTSLLEAAVRSATQAGFRSLLVRTEVTNERALRFYRSRGFTDSRTVVEDVEGTPMRLVQLTRTL